MRRSTGTSFDIRWIAATIFLLYLVFVAAAGAFAR